MTYQSVSGTALRGLAAALRRLRGWMAAREGVAAVEFALILPFMVFVYFGMTEISFLVSTNRKLDLASRTIGDLTGRASSMNKTELLNIMNAAEGVMVPFRTTGLRIVVSSVAVTTTKNAQGQITSATGTVSWSCSRASATTLGAGLAKGSTLAVPAGFETAQSFIWTSLEMPYAPLFGSSVMELITGRAGLTLDQTMAWPVRDAGQVAWTNFTSCNA